MNSIIPYPGGKSLLAKSILPMIPPHECWVEAFCGAAWLTFAKDPAISGLEVINDKYRWLVNFWRVIKRCPEKFLEQADMEIRSRSVFDTYKAWHADGVLVHHDDPVRGLMPDAEAAWAFWYLINSTFTASMSYPRWKYNKANRPVSRKTHLVDVLRRWPDVEAVYHRLQKVDIECLDFRDLIKRYDAPTTVFFCDPPYWEAPSGPEDYVERFCEADHRDLSYLLRNLKGKFILTYEDSDSVWLAYSWSEPKTYFAPVQFNYSVPHKGSAGESKSGRELIITNYDPAQNLGPLFAALQ